MASILKFDEWQTPTGTTVGTILQVVSASYNTPTSTNVSSSYTNLFGVNITPRTTNSKILIFGTVAVGGKGAISIFKDSTNLFPANKAHQIYTGFAQTSWDNGSDRQVFTYQFYDTPGSTALINYSLRMRAYGTDNPNNIGVNENGSASSFQGTILTAMEIAA